MSEIKLKRCPFCGVEARIDSNRECYGHGDYREEMFVECVNCGASSERTWKSKKEDAINKTIEQWNTRKPMEDIVDRLEEFKEVFFYEMEHNKYCRLHFKCPICNGEFSLEHQGLKNICRCPHCNRGLSTGFRK